MAEIDGGGEGPGDEGGVGTALESDSGAAGIEETEPTGDLAEGGEEPDLEAEPDETAPEDAEDEEVEASPDEGAADAEATEQESTEQPEYQQFTFAVNGADTPMPGVYKNPADGSLYVHPEAVEGVTRAFADARLRETIDKKEMSTLRRQLAESKARFDEAAVRNQATAAFWEKKAENPEEFIQFMANYQARKPELEAARKEAVAKEYFQRAQMLQEPSPEDRAQRDEQVVEATIKDVCANLLRMPNIREALTDDQMDGFGELLYQNRRQMFTRANADRENGTKKGMLEYQVAYVNDMLKWYLGSVGQKREQEAKVAGAREFNKQRATGSRRMPPAVGTRQTASSGAKQSIPKFKNFAEWQEWFLSRDKEPGDATLRIASA